MTGYAVFLGVLALAGLSAMAAEPGAALEKLPEGNVGIAAKYPGDKGIEKDASVVFTDDFEQEESAADLRSKWGNAYGPGLSIVAEPANANGGRKSLLITMPRQNEPLSVGVDRALDGTHDVLFMRWYMKFDPEWFVKGGSVHNGSSISSKYVTPDGQSTPGVRADGKNKFLAAFECENSSGVSPGRLNAYVYWAEQFDRYGDHMFCSGEVIPNSYSRSGKATFGPQFVKREDFTPQLGRWYCYEAMLKANTPGARDGRLAMWIDGKLVADFPNMRLRDVPGLKIDRFSLGVYIAQNSERVNRKWHDDVVVATSYIGPMVLGK